LNYRHQFHAGNFADVMKHVLLLQLMRGMQRKEKGFLYLDTHAGRGRYDLAAAAQGDSLARKPEHPDGIGRLESEDGLLPPVAEYVKVVRDFDRVSSVGGKGSASSRFYPGSPWVALAAARPQDRLTFCEKHPEEAALLKDEFYHERRVSVQTMDGYTAIRAMLPASEKRALVLIDPPFEAQDEFAQILRGLGDGLTRMSGATFAVWYPLTERARVDEFLGKWEMMRPPPTFTAELTIAGENAPMKLKGCGLLVVNPPWQIDREIAPVLDSLATLLAQAPGGAGRLRWIVGDS
jgi:23S rRNA (adenine2030-N6)-methyltransferase